MDDIDVLVEEGIAAFKEGQRVKAQELLTQAVELNERNEKAWLWLSGAVDADEDRRVCLENVLAINPDNAAALSGLARLDAEQSEAPAESANAEEAAEFSAEPPWADSPLTGTGETTGAFETGLDSLTSAWDEEQAFEQDDIDGAGESFSDGQGHGGSETAPQQAPWEEGYAEQEMDPEAAELAPASFVDDRPPSEMAPTQQTRPRPAAKAKPVTKKTSGDTVLLIAAVGFLILVCMVAAFALLVPRLGDLARSEPGEATAPDASQAVLAVLRENLTAYNGEDIDRYMRTIHPGSPAYAQTQATLEDMVDLFDLTATWDKAQVDEINAGEARVSFILTTRKLSGPAFRDNTIAGMITLKLDDGQWKIYDQSVDDIQYLN